MREGGFKVGDRVRALYSDGWRFTAGREYVVGDVVHGGRVGIFADDSGEPNGWDVGCFVKVERAGDGEVVRPSDTKVEALIRDEKAKFLADDDTDVVDDLLGELREEIEARIGYDDHSTDAYEFRAWLADALGVLSAIRDEVDEREEG